METPFLDAESAADKHHKELSTLVRFKIRATLLPLLE
jgi:hypothetical protein